MERKIYIFQFFGPGILEYVHKKGWRSAYAKFVVPYWGIKSTMAKGYRAGPPAYVAWRAGTRQPYAIVNFIPLVMDYEYVHICQYANVVQHKHLLTAQ